MSNNDNNTPQLPEHVSKNRDMWNATSDEYERHNARVLSAEHTLTWGNWRTPETQLHVYSEVADKDILEWSFVIGGQ